MNIKKYLLICCLLSYMMATTAQVAAPPPGLSPATKAPATISEPGYASTSASPNTSQHAPKKPSTAVVHPRVIYFTVTRPGIFIPNVAPSRIRP